MKNSDELLQSNNIIGLKPLVVTIHQLIYKFSSASLIIKNVPLKAHLQPTGFACLRTIFVHENPAKAEIYPIRSL